MKSFACKSALGIVSVDRREVDGYKTYLICRTSVECDDNRPDLVKTALFIIYICPI